MGMLVLGQVGDGDDGFGLAKALVQYGAEDLDRLFYPLHRGWGAGVGDGFQAAKVVIAALGWSIRANSMVGTTEISVIFSFSTVWNMASGSNLACRTSARREA